MYKIIRARGIRCFHETFFLVCKNTMTILLVQMDTHTHKCIVVTFFCSICSRFEGFFTISWSGLALLLVEGGNSCSHSGHFLQRM